MATLLVCIPLSHAGPQTIPLPRRSRLVDGAYNSPRTFGKTVEYYRRVLRRKRVAFTEHPPQQLGAVSYARFVATQRDAGFYAIHVFTHQGKTRIRMITWPDLSSLN